MSLNLFRRLDRYDRRIRQLERTEPPEGGGGGGGDHADSDHADAFSALGHAHAGTYAPVEHDTADDDRFSQLAHVHAVHADSDHDDRFALIEHDAAHSDVFAPTLAGMPDGGTAGQALVKETSTDYDVFWADGVAPIAQPLSWLTDVDTPLPSTNDFLMFNGTSWIDLPVTWGVILSKPSTFPPSEHDSDHDDRFVQLPGAWQTPSLLNSWVNFGGVFQTARYRKENDVVVVEGLIKSGTMTSGTVLFNLPAGYRPVGSHVFNQPLAAAVDVRVDVVAGGDVALATAAGTNTFLSLDGIRFAIT